MPTFLITTVIAALALLSSCARDTRWTILRPDYGAALAHQCSRSFPAGLSGSWTPKEGDVLQAEAAITGAIQSAFLRIPARYRDAEPGEYNRQYTGFFKGAKRVLYVNGARKASLDEIAKFEPSRANWRAVPAMACDGSTDYFGAVFDPESRAVTDFEFNGPHPPSE